jgi:general secretion pathway protein H
MSSTGGNDRGFTLLELLIVMALLSMTAALALAWTSGLADQIAVTRSADTVERELSRLSVKATSTGQDQIVVLQTSGSTPSLNLGDRLLELASDVVLNWKAAAEAGTNNDRAVIAFFGAGGASGGSIEIARGGAQAKLEIDWLSAKVRRPREQQ